MKRVRKGGCAGFTLIELLVVIVVIMVLVGILMPTVYGTKKQAKNRQARAEIKALVAAIVNYKFTNREWPTSTENKDVIFSRDNDSGGKYKSEAYKNLLDKLTDKEPPYLDESDFKIGNDSILDPWGTPYAIAVDSDYDGEVLVPAGSHWNTNIEGVVIWSYGPDEVTSFPGDGESTSYQNDDIRSW